MSSGGANTQCDDEEVAVVSKERTEEGKSAGSMAYFQP